MFEHLSKFLNSLRIGSDGEKELFFSSRLNAGRVRELCAGIQYEYRERVYPFGVERGFGGLRNGFVWDGG